MTVPDRLLSPEQFVQRTKATVRLLGAAFGDEPTFDTRARELGIDRWSFYFGGRAGVLGPTSADVVAAACGFFGADLVEASWANALSAHDCETLVNADIDLCVRWWRDRLRDQFESTDDLVRLTSCVIEHADANGRPLFAAWRRRARQSAEGVERLALNMLCLREHRGGSHIIAVAAAGLAPLDAVMASGGRRKALASGFTLQPLQHGDVKVNLMEVEEVTDQLAAKSFTHVTAIERGRLAVLLEQVRVMTKSG